MGLMQRNKGKAFERKVASIIRAKFPGVTVRRSSQAERAYQSDVFCVGHPVLERLWMELCDAHKPNPSKKMKQAVRDIDVSSLERTPVVVWHRIHEREVWATLKLSDLPPMQQSDAVWPETLVTMRLADFLDLV